MNNDKRAEIIRGLRNAAEACQHYQSFSKRMQSHFENHLPGYTIHMQVSNKPFSSNRVHVWGNDVKYDDGVDISFSGTTTDWFKSFNESLDIADKTDYTEREIDEEKLVPVLEELNAKVEALQAEAMRLYSTLPVPRSATVRKASHFWESPSWKMRKRFPKLFDL